VARNDEPGARGSISTAHSPRVIDAARADRKPRAPGLPDFIRANTEQILGEWENGVRARWRQEEAMSVGASREHRDRRC
jgi:hypothetical protein